MLAMACSTVTNLTSKPKNNRVIHFTLNGIVLNELWARDRTKSGNNDNEHFAILQRTIGANSTITSGFSYFGTANFTVTSSDPDVIIYSPTSPLPPPPLYVVTITSTSNWGNAGNGTITVKNLTSTTIGLFILL